MMNAKTENRNYVAWLVWFFAGLTLSIMGLAQTARASSPPSFYCQNNRGEYTPCGRTWNRQALPTIVYRGATCTLRINGVKASTNHYGGRLKIQQNEVFDGKNKVTLNCSNNAQASWAYIRVTGHYGICPRWTQHYDRRIWK